jgi:histidyl-tRNA synthetase
LLQELRQAGLAADMDFEGRSLKAQMSMADRLGASFVVILGERELERDEVVLRHMATSQQQTVPTAQLLPRLAAQLQVGF